jgi:hypothetical protein
VLDPKAFDEQMNRLKLLPTQGGFEGPTEFATRKLVYFDALRELDTARFVGACKALLKQPGRVWFPTPGEIVEAAEAWAPPVTGALPAPRGVDEIEASRERIDAALGPRREEARANARGGLEILERELKALGVPVPAVLVRNMPASTGEEA